MSILVSLPASSNPPAENSGSWLALPDDQLRIHSGTRNEPNTLSARSGEVVASLTLADMVDLEAEKTGWRRSSPSRGREIAAPRSNSRTRASWIAP